MKSKLQLTRRSMLRGVGACVGLPFLEAMSPIKSTANAALGADGQSVRFAGLFMPHGRPPKSWDIEGNTLDTLPEVLQPLEALKEYVTVFQHINSPNGAHNRGLPGFLTGNQTTRTSNAAEASVKSPTIDQIIGAEYEKAFPLPTMEFGMHSPQPGLGMEGSTNIYSTFVSWKSATTPVPFEFNPQRAFDRLFKGVRANSDQPSIQSSVNPDQSVIDGVLDDAKSLQRKLGIADQRKLDEYLTAVREVEQRLEKQSLSTVRLDITNTMMSDIKKTNRKLDEVLGSKQQSLGSIPKISLTDYIQLLMDVMALAFWSNSTISSTLMFGNGGGGHNMRFLPGVKTNHHRMTHHKNQEHYLKMYTTVNAYFVSQVGYLMERLRTMEEGGSNVLENSIILFGSNTGDGNGHTKSDIPLMIAGKGGGKIKGNQNIDGKGAQISTVHNAILEKMGIDKTIGVDKNKIQGL